MSSNMLNLSRSIEIRQSKVPLLFNHWKVIFNLFWVFINSVLNLFWTKLIDVHFQYLMVKTRMHLCNLSLSKANRESRNYLMCLGGLGTCNLKTYRDVPHFWIHFLKEIPKHGSHFQAKILNYGSNFQKYYGNSKYVECFCSNIAKKWVPFLGKIPNHGYLFGEKITPEAMAPKLHSRVPCFCTNKGQGDPLNPLMGCTQFARKRQKDMIKLLSCMWRYVMLLCPFSKPTYWTVADLRKRALSAAYIGGPSLVLKFHFGRPKTNFSGKKQGFFAAACHATLQPICLCNFFGPGARGPYLFGGPCKNILGGTLSAVADS